MKINEKSGTNAENINEVYEKFEKLQTQKMVAAEDQGPESNYTDSEYSDSDYTDGESEDDDIVEINNPQLNKNSSEESRNDNDSVEVDLEASILEIKPSGQENGKEQPEPHDVVQTDQLSTSSASSLNGPKFLETEDLLSEIEIKTEQESDNTQKSVEDALDQNEPFDELEQIYNDYIKDDLKKILKSNRLAVTGNKETLIRRIMENIPNYKNALSSIQKN